MPHATLSLQWSADDSVTIVVPYSESGAGYGVDYVEFIDGSLVTIDEIVKSAGGLPEIDLHAGKNILAYSHALAGGAGNA